MFLGWTIAFFPSVESFITEVADAVVLTGYCRSVVKTGKGELEFEVMLVIIA
jgi:hypothetical protein